MNKPRRLLTIVDATVSAAATVPLFAVGALDGLGVEVLLAGH
jgi:hypothetical protein